MQSLANVLRNTNKYRTTEINKYNKPSSYKTTDLLIAEVTDLINPDYQKWHCRTAFKLGREKYLKLASIARADGRDPKRYFSLLCNQALQNHSPVQTKS